jgi:hypothetical protein
VYLQQRDVHLASISGGTDILGCFMLGRQAQFTVQITHFTLFSTKVYCSVVLQYASCFRLTSAVQHIHRSFKLAVPPLSTTLAALAQSDKTHSVNSVDCILRTLPLHTGNPNLPVYSGEIQGPGLGMDICALNDATNEPVIGEKGELVCRTPFPSMPTQFLNDPVSARTYTFKQVDVCVGSV